MDALALARAALGLVLVVWAPGYAWSYVFFPSAGWVERAAASVLLSIALMALLSYLGSVILRVDVSAAHAVLWSSLLVVSALAVILARREGAIERPLRPA